MSALGHVEPGWLGKTIAEAGRRLRAQFRPMELVRRGQTVTLPLNDKDAAELFADLNSHFYAWTGKTLADHIRCQASGAAS